MTDVAARLGAALADRYRLERELGAGGMATVYLAQDLRHDRRVAIKVLRPELAAAIGAERFLAEIRTTANLQHPHILPLFDSGQARGPDSTFLFYVMPYVEGESLRDRLTREKQLPIADAVRTATEVADALDYAHRHGVVHRDIKPENILLHDGRALVADFGIALAASKAGESRMTQTGMSLGTPSYMSPEQAMGEREIGPRSDIYSLGATTYEMLVGDPPFSGNTAQSIVAKVMTEKPIPPSRLRDTVPAPVERAVLTALQKLPADRFGSAKEFSEALRKVGTGGEGGEGGTSTRTYADTVPLGVARRPARRWLVPLLSALSVASVLAALYLYTRRPTASGTPIRFALEYAPGVRVATPITNPLAISPDGSMVAFSGRVGSGPFQIFVRPMADLAERALPGTEGGEQPCFSPDGKWIAFVARHQLKKVALAGGAPSVVADVPGLMYGCSWTRDGRIVVSRGYRLEIVPDVGGTPGPLSPGDTTKGYLVIHPKVLPDGKTVIMTRWRGSAPTSRLWRATIGTGQASDLGVAGGSFLGLLDGQLIYGATGGTLMAARFDARQGKVTGQPVPVLEGIGGTSILAAQAALSPSGSLVYQAGDTKGNMVLVDLRGTVRSVLPESHNYANPRFSPDGSRIAVSVDERGTRDIWVYDLRSRTLSRATTEGTANDRPEWSNGSRLVFRSNRDGDMAYWSQAADGSGKGDVFARIPGREIWEGVPSRDGRWFVYRTGTVGSADIWVKGVERDTTPRLLLGSVFTEWAARLSPDGNWLAYESDESGEYEVYVRPLAEGGTRLQVSVDGGVEPIWSPDGKRLFYWRGEELMLATLTTSPVLSVTTRALLFRGDPPTTTGHANYDVSPDGEQVVLIRPLLDSIRTVVVHHWDQELRARLAGTGR